MYASYDNETLVRSIIHWKVFKPIPRRNLWRFVIFVMYGVLLYLLYLMLGCKFSLWSPQHVQQILTERHRANETVILTTRYIIRRFLLYSTYFFIHENELETSSTNWPLFGLVRKLHWSIIGCCSKQLGLNCVPLCGCMLQLIYDTVHKSHMEHFVHPANVSKVFILHR